MIYNFYKKKGGIILLLLLLSSCIANKNINYSYPKILKDSYVVDTISIKNPVIIMNKNMPYPKFVCSKDSLDGIIKTKKFYDRPDVFALGGMYIFRDKPYYYNYPDCNLHFVATENKFDILEYKGCSSFVLVLVPTYVMNDMYTQFFDDCVDNSCKKEKRYYIKIKHPNNFYNRIVYPLCE